MPNSSNDFIELDSNLAEGMESFLIEAVRQHPIIYKHSDKPRTKESVRKLSETWNEISDELNVEVESCKTLWSCIKQKFIKYRKRKQHGVAVHREWLAYEGLLEWLDEHIKRRRTRNDLIKQLNLTTNKIEPKEEPSGKVTPIAAYDEHEIEMIGDPEAGEWKLCTLVSNPSGRSEEVSSSSKKGNNTTSTMFTYLGKRKMHDTTADPSGMHHSMKQKLKRDNYNTNLDSIVYQTVDDDEHSEIFAELELTDAGGSSFAEASANTKQSQNTAVVGDVFKVLPEDRLISDSNASREHQGIHGGGEALSLGRDGLGTNLEKLESVITKCVELAEKCVVNCTNQDSNEVFGKFIASMVRELPTEKRMKARFEVIQFTGDLISKLMNSN